MESQFMIYKELTTVKQMSF